MFSWLDEQIVMPYVPPVCPEETDQALQRIAKVVRAGAYLVMVVW